MLLGVCLLTMRVQVLHTLQDLPDYVCCIKLGVVPLLSHPAGAPKRHTNIRACICCALHLLTGSELYKDHLDTVQLGPYERNHAVLVKHSCMPTA